MHPAQPLSPPIAAAVEKSPSSFTPTGRHFGTESSIGQSFRWVRHGKRILVHLEDQGAIVIEPRMSGLVLVDTPPSLEHLRLELRLTSAACPQIRFWDRRGLGKVRLLNHEQLREMTSQKMGPDALQISCGRLMSNLAHRRTAIKVALLDQSAVAGVGNIYASELLHRARVHPACPVIA